MKRSLLSVMMPALMSGQNAEIRTAQAGHLAGGPDKVEPIILSSSQPLSGGPYELDSGKC